MTIRFKYSVLSIQLLLAAALPAFASDYKIQMLEKAHEMFQVATNSTMYAETARQYEYLIQEEGVRNGNLFYTAGNSWFMAHDIGRAILNYRRAEQYLPHDENIQHNLKSALALRTDLIPAKPPHPMAAKLLGWHLSTSTTLRWQLLTGCWLLFWGAWLWTSRSPKKEARIMAAITGLLSVVLLSSLLTESLMKRRAEPGVIVSKEVLARKGNGAMYAPAFQEPLHSGTEFSRLEDRDNWWHIRLANGQTCWIPASAAATLSL